MATSSLWWAIAQTHTRPEIQSRNIQTLCMSTCVNFRPPLRLVFVWCDERFPMQQPYYAFLISRRLLTPKYTTQTTRRPDVAPNGSNSLGVTLPITHPSGLPHDVSQRVVADISHRQPKIMLSPQHRQIVLIKCCNDQYA